MKQSSFGKHQN